MRGVAHPVIHFALLPDDPGIVRVSAGGREPVTDELRAQMEGELAALARFLGEQFGERPFRVLTVLEELPPTRAREAERISQAALALAGAFRVERAAYVTDDATVRLQFGRLFRENKLADRFRAFPTEKDGLAFLRGDRG
jgi:hypothetical protein